MKNRNLVRSLGLTKWSLASFVIYLLIQTLILIPPMLMRQIIDVNLPNNETGRLVINILLFAGIPFLYLIGQSIYNYYAICFARNKGQEISMRILKNLLNQKMSYFDEQNSMELLSYSSKEAINYLYFHMMERPQYYVNILFALIIEILLFTYSPWVALIQLLFIPLAILPSSAISKKLQTSINSVLEDNAKLNQLKSDILRGILTVKQLRIEDNRLKKVDEINQNIVKQWGVVAALDQTSASWTSTFLSKLFTALSFGLTAFLIMYKVKPEISIGALVSIMAYAALLYSSLSTIFRNHIETGKNEAEYEKLFSYYTMEGESEENIDKKPFEFKDKIELRDLSFRYSKDKDYTWKNLNITIERGKWTGLMGASGIGKSTLLNVLLKFYDIESGNISVDGIDYKQIDSFSIRDKITKVSQDLFFFPGSLRDNLLLANEQARDAEMLAVLDKVCLSDYISKLPNGLDTEIGEAGKLMSGGEKQRLSLAQALLRGNKILFLDEISANLDKDTESILKKRLRELVVKEGYTILSISHNDEFLSSADRIYLIEKDGAKKL